MRIKFFLFAICFCCLSAIHAQTDDRAITYDVYFLAGQSNMEGFGYVKDLSPLQRKPHPSVLIFHGNPRLDDLPDGGIGMWAELRPGHGFGFKAESNTNYYSLRFGPELSFGQTIAKLSDNPVAIIKYAMGGTALSEGSGYGNWSPTYKDGKGINQFDHALATLSNALSEKDIDGDGTVDKLMPAGIIWMQGEADSHSSQAHADAYKQNLTEIMYLFRQAFKLENLPVVIGKVTRTHTSGSEIAMPYIKTVQKAQQDFVSSDSCAAYINTTDTYGKSDQGWHYDSKGYLTMGETFAKAVHQLKTKCSAQTAD